MSTEQTRWLLKVLQPERTLASFPGAAGLSQEIHAALLGLSLETYSGELFRLRAEAKQAASELLDEPGVASMLDHLPLRKAAKVVAFGDSLTSEPQSWAVILSELLAARRPTDEVSLTISAVGGETTTHALVRMGQVVAQQPDWILFFVGTNDGRTQGPQATKTLVHHEESARNLAELRRRASQETKARCLWLTPPAVDEALVAAHQGLARFGVRFRNADLGRIAKLVREIDERAVDLFSTLGTPPPTGLLLADGLHFSLAGQKRLALEVLSHWSKLP
jgi:lysophospholipase L1-like esterase